MPILVPEIVTTEAWKSVRHHPDSHDVSYPSFRQYLELWPLFSGWTLQGHKEKEQSALIMRSVQAQEVSFRFDNACMYITT